MLDYIENFEQSESTEDSVLEEEPDSRISDALQNYFSSVKSLVGKEGEPTGSKKKLDYFLSKRFLMTAYNNLKNFDPAIHDHRDITEKLTLIKELQKAYHNAGDKVNVPELAFEMIFLRNQPEYVKYISDKEEYIRQISLLKITEESLSPEIQEREVEIKKLSKNDKRRNVLEDKIKPIR